MDTTAAIVLAVFFVVAVYGAIRYSLYMSRRSICKVITTFRRQGAIKPEYAATIQELNLAGSPFRFLRDYRPWALQTLVQANVVRSVETGKFFLSENTLLETNIDAGCPIKSK